MTNILVPTDFTAASLKMAEGVLRSEGCPKCNLVLFHAFQMPDPHDLLYKLYRDPSLDLMTEEFRQTCKQLKDEHKDRIGKIIVRCMRGSNKAVFRNFLEANDIDLIYCPDDYVYVPAHKESVEPTSLFKKCGVPVIKDRTTIWKPAFSSPVFNTVRIPARS